MATPFRHTASICKKMNIKDDKLKEQVHIINEYIDSVKMVNSRYGARIYTHNSCLPELISSISKYSIDYRFDNNVLKEVFELHCKEDFLNVYPSLNDYFDKETKDIYDIKECYEKINRFMKFIKFNLKSNNLVLQFMDDIVEWAYYSNDNAWIRNLIIFDNTFQYIISMFMNHELKDGTNIRDVFLRMQKNFGRMDVLSLKQTNNFVRNGVI